jgi:hypothetical protein
MADEKKDRLRELDDLDKELLRLKLEQPGRSNVDLATLTKHSWRTTIRRTSRPEFQAALKEYQKEAIDIVVSAKKEALRTIVRLMRSKDERVALKAALALGADELPAKKIDVAHSGKLTLEQLDLTRCTTEQLIRLKAGESPDLIYAELSRN